MAQTFSRRPGTTAAVLRSGNKRPSAAKGDKSELWSSLLDNVSSGKRLPQKSLLVLGGSPETQKEFLESLSQDPNSRRRPPDRNRRQPPIANRFALGYTYQDVLDADHEDTLARLSIFMLSEPLSAYATLLKPRLTRRTIPNTSVVILLDWSKPWSWARELRQWIQLLRSVMLSLDDDCKEALDENVTTWQHKLAARTGTDANPGSALDMKMAMPLGPGEYDEPLGLPINVICQNANTIDILEKERSYDEEDIDFIMQYLRTILLKHGAGLIYTMPLQPGQLQALVHASLGIRSQLNEKTGLKHNVVDRERIVIPPGWDSWGKIRVLREGFDVESVSKAWGVDIQTPSPRQSATDGSNAENGESDHEQAIAGANIAAEDPISLTMYEDVIRDPDLDTLDHSTRSGPPVIEVECMPDQQFLAEQQKRLEEFRKQDEREKEKAAKESRAHPANLANAEEGAGKGVSELIGPVQVNMGGIQADAEDLVRRLRERDTAPAERTSRAATPASPAYEPKTTEELSSFFAGLIKKTGGLSAGNSPRS
ncbi:hypothetical protein LTR66_002211 [Elasticomyces elasticus]|nr:hypothetical protein LTR66_002211 [Elasticomyces elasticus]